MKNSNEQIYACPECSSKRYFDINSRTLGYLAVPKPKLGKTIIKVICGEKDCTQTFNYLPHTGETTLGDNIGK